MEFEFHDAKIESISLKEKGNLIVVRFSKIFTYPESIENEDSGFYSTGILRIRNPYKILIEGFWSNEDGISDSLITNRYNSEVLSENDLLNSEVSLGKLILELPSPASIRVDLGIASMSIGKPVEE